jgi:chromosome segregation ATPase
MPKSWEEQVADKPAGASPPVALWIVTVLALLIAGGGMFGLMKSNHEQKSLRAQVTSQQQLVTGLQSSLSSARTQIADMAKADSVKDAKFASQLASAKREAADALAAADSVATRLASAENSVTQLAAAQAALPTKPQVADMVKAEVAPLLAAQAAANTADSTKLASMSSELKNQADRLSIVSKKTEKSNFEKVWQAVVVSVAVTGLFTGGH